MKKLSLKDLKLGEDELLQREQLKTVFGGYGGGGIYSCTVKCADGVLLENAPDCQAETMQWACQNHGTSNVLCSCLDHPF